MSSLNFPSGYLEIFELKAFNEGPAHGIVLDSTTVKGQGAVATVLVQEGNLKVGDMPQFTMAMGGTITPVEGAKIQALYRFYALHYADWGVSSREGGDDRAQVWKAPSYGVLDIHASYDLPIELGSTKPSVFLHVFNALDETYIQDATDNSRYNAWSDQHRASDAEVFFGMPTSFNLGLRVNF